MLRTARRKCSTPQVAIYAPSHKFVLLYLRNSDIYRQSEKAC